MRGKRWEQMVERAQRRYDPDGTHLLSTDVVKLLTRQHAVCRATILRYRRGLNYGTVVPGDMHARGMIDGAIETCNDLLAALATRKGTL